MTVRSPAPFLIAILCIGLGSGCEESAGPPYSGAPPQLQVDSPHNFQLVEGSVHLAASCTDDGPRGCTALTAALQRTTGSGNWTALHVLGHADDSLSVDAELPVPPGLYTVAFDAWDEASQFTRAWIHVFRADLPSNVQRIADLPGLAAAYDGERIVWLEEPGATAGSAELEIHVASVQGDAGVVVGATSSPNVDGELPSVDLVSDGVFVVADQQAKSDYLVSAFYPIAAEAGGPHAGRWFGGRAGSFYIWSDFGEVTSRGTNALWRGSPDGQIEVWPSRTTGADVAEDGDVVFSATIETISTVFLYEGEGTLSEIGPGQQPTTDGTSIAYFRQDDDGHPLVLRDPDGAEEIVSSAGADPILRGGFLAYMRPTAAGGSDVWVRSPDGLQTRLSALVAGSSLQSLGPAGQVILRQGTSYHLALPPYGGTDIRVLYDAEETGFPAPVLVDGEPHVLIGDAVLALQR